MKIKFSVLNRLSMLGLLTNKGDATSLKILRELREQLSFSEEEHKVLKFQQLPGKMAKWVEVPAKEFEFIEGSIREQLLEEVKTNLKAQEKAKTLELDYLDLYEVLIEDNQKELDEVGAAIKEKEQTKTE